VVVQKYQFPIVEVFVSGGRGSDDRSMSQKQARARDVIVRHCEMER
jgi:hypothetical protein